MYDAIIKEQPEVSPIEGVLELKTPDKVYYLSHHTVVRNEAKTVYMWGSLAATVVQNFDPV